MALLYKYLSPERVTYLSDTLLRVSQPSALNDPFECLPALPDSVAQDVIEHTVSHLKRANQQHESLGRQFRRQLARNDKKAAAQAEREIRGNPEALFDKFFKQSAERIDATLGVLSLSARWDRALMWAHYASSHTGFCVAFHSDHPFFNSSPHFLDEIIGPQQVSYSKGRVELSKSPLDRAGVIRLLCTKSTDWAYEEEIRLVRALGGATKTVETLGLPICLFSVPHDAVAEVVVGMNASPAVFKAVFAFARFRAVPAFQTQVSRTSFDIARSRSAG